MRCVHQLPFLLLSLTAVSAQATDPRPDAAPAYAPLPQALSSFGAAVSDGWLYAYGGHSGRTHQYSTESALGAFRRLNLIDGQRWEELPGGPRLQGMGLVAHGGKLYRLGGMQSRNAPDTPNDSISVADCARFDPATRQWEPIPPLPAGRSSFDAVVIGDTINVVGGWTMNGGGQRSVFADTALKLDLSQSSPKWESIPQPFRRRALTAAAHTGKVYVIAGLTVDGEMDLSVNVLDPAANTWTTGPKLPGPIGNGFSPAACAAGGQLYVTTADGKCWQLAAAGEAWEQVGALTQPRIVHRMVPAAADRLLALGGSSKGGTVALTEALTPNVPPQLKAGSAK